MQHREPPRPINYKRRLPAHLKNDPQVRKWAKRLQGDDEALPTDLSDEQLAFVVLEVAKRRGRQSWLDPDLFLKAMADTTPVIAAPKLERDKLTEDLALIWSQPEMRTMWDSWDGRRSCKGPKPDFLSGKAIAAVLAMAGISAHVDDARAELCQNRGLWNLMQRLERRAAPIQSYENITRQIPRLYSHDLVIATNIAMIKALRDMHPGAGIGERLMIDGMGRPAWCAQLPKGKNERQEEYRRRFCPEAGPRAYIHTPRGKDSVGTGTQGKGMRFLAKGKFWRGYYDVCIADQATGLPLVWMSRDANEDEAACIVPLLSDLFRHWPECPATLIAGDSAWDEDFWCRLLEVEYGVHPIFRLHDETKVAQVGGASRDHTVIALTERGELVCGRHGKPAAMVGTEGPSRQGLRPGQTADERHFRIRANCAKGCGKLGLKMGTDWSRLTHYPHHGHGGAAIKQRYAMRHAMLRRLNGMEGIWQRLQGGKKLGTNDADRTRIRDKDGHDLLVDLALVSMTAASLADERGQRGIAVPKLPPVPWSPGQPNRRPNRRGGILSSSAAAASAVSAPAAPKKTCSAPNPSLSPAAAPAPPVVTDEIEELELHCLV